MKIIRPITITAAMLTYSNVVDETLATYDPAATYTKLARVIRTLDGIPQIFESQLAGNKGNTPETSPPTTWAPVTATNKWRMFDAANSSQSTASNTLSCTVTTSGQRVDSVALMNVNGAVAEVKMTSSIDGMVFDQTVSLVDNSAVVDAYSWLFEPIVRKEDVLFEGMPPYASATIDVTVTDPGGTPACGTCSIGQMKYVGDTQFGMSLDTDDYSLKQKDAYGNYTVRERPFSKAADFEVLIKGVTVDALNSLLALYRATPIVYIGTGDYASSMILGFYDGYSIKVNLPTYSTLTIHINGMT